MTGQDFNQRMREARAASGLTLNDVYYEIRRQLGDTLKVSPATIQRYEGGPQAVKESRANPLIVRFLCSLYGVPFAEVAPNLSAAFDVVIDLTGDDQDDPVFPCNPHPRSLALAGV